MKRRSQSKKYTDILNTINSPCDVKNLTHSEILSLADEIRGFLIEKVGKNGGHLASNLGVVELSIALHRVFDAPHDHIIWDVGHQCYVHKILTGRRGEFDTLRRGGGLSGFTCRDESEYDCFGAGHSSTSLSAALGFAESDKLSGSDAFTVAIIGDGAFTGGMIHEALNNCDKNLKLIIIINENEMSISKNTGRFAQNLAELRSKAGYFRTKKTTGNIIKKIPLLGKPLFRFIRDFKKVFKNILYGSNYFEDIGLYYIGPVDGNDELTVETVLGEAKKLGESVIIHLKTKKGMGYAPAEEKPHLYHSQNPEGCEAPAVTFSYEFGRILCEVAAENENIVAITAAMSSGTGLERFRCEYPKRFYDVGIAEAHALTFAAGLAAGGKIPVAAIYSTFLQRGFDSIVHDIALQRLPVVMCIDRAGLNPRDGVTHFGVFDVAFLSGLPGVRIYTPATFEALGRAMIDALYSGVPCAVRYPAGDEDRRIKDEFYPAGEVARSAYVRRGRGFPDRANLVIISHGRIAGEAVQACELLRRRGVRAGALLLEQLTPYDVAAEEIERILGRMPEDIVFLEEEIRAGGMGMMMSDALARRGCIRRSEVMIIGLENPFDRQREDVPALEYYGLDARSVVERIIGK